MVRVCSRGRRHRYSLLQLQESASLTISSFSRTQPRLAPGPARRRRRRPSLVPSTNAPPLRSLFRRQSLSIPLTGVVSHHAPRTWSAHFILPKSHLHYLHLILSWQAVPAASSTLVYLSPTMHLLFLPIPNVALSRLQERWASSSLKSSRSLLCLGNHLCRGRDERFFSYRKRSPELS